MDANNYMAELMAGGGGTGRPVGRPKGPEKEKLPAIHLRDVPASVKNALSALMEVETIGFDEDGLSLRSTYGSQGQAAKTLMVYGMAHIKPYMVAEWERERCEGKAHGEITRRFLDDMTLPFVTEADFPEGSDAHVELLSIRDNFVTCGGEPNTWASIGWDREEAFQHVAAIHWRVKRLEIALQAIETAVVEHLGNRQKL